MTSFKICNPALVINLPQSPAVLPISDPKMQQSDFGLSKYPTNSNNFNPFADYLGLSQMVERRHMADNFEKLVSETCIVPGADIYNEVNRLFFQNEGSSVKRERINSWTSNSDSGNSSVSSQSPVSCLEASKYANSAGERRSQYNMVSSRSPSVTSNMLLKPAPVSLHLNLPKSVSNAASQSQTYLSCQSTSTASSPVVSSSQTSSRLPPSVQLARKLTAKSMCVFCKNNGEMETVFGSHVLKNEEGSIVCPILRAYTCPICGVSGDNAHTIKYCPQGNNESTIKALKQTRNSTARRSSAISGMANAGSMLGCGNSAGMTSGLGHTVGHHQFATFGQQQMPPVVSSPNSHQVAAAAALLNAANLYNSCSGRKY